MKGVVTIGHSVVGGQVTIGHSVVVGHSVIGGQVTTGHSVMTGVTTGHSVVVGHSVTVGHSVVTVGSDRVECDSEAKGPLPASFSPATRNVYMVPGSRFLIVTFCLDVMMVLVAPSQLRILDKILERPQMISFQAIHFVPPQGDQIGVDCCWPEGLWGAAGNCIYRRTGKV